MRPAASAERCGSLGPGQAWPGRHRGLPRSPAGAEARRPQGCASQHADGSRGRRSTRSTRSGPYGHPRSLPEKPWISATSSTCQASEGWLPAPRGAARECPAVDDDGRRNALDRDPREQPSGGCARLRRGRPSEAAAQRVRTRPLGIAALRPTPGGDRAPGRWRPSPEGSDQGGEAEGWEAWRDRCPPSLGPPRAHPWTRIVEARRSECEMWMGWAGDRR